MQGLWIYLFLILCGLHAKFDEFNINQSLQSVPMTLRRRTWYWNMYFHLLGAHGVPHRRRMCASAHQNLPLTIQIRLNYLDTVYSVYI